MYYEINVSLNGKHLFATADRSITVSWKAEEIYKLFKEKFPESEGYKISVTKWEKFGREININEA